MKTGYLLHITGKVFFMRLCSLWNTFGKCDSAKAKKKEKQSYRLRKQSLFGSSNSLYPLSK